MTEVYIALVPVLLLLLREAIKDVRAWRKRERDKKPFKKAFIDIASVYQELNELMHSTGASRILLLRSHNGGGKPQLGKPLYSTAEYEVYSKGSVSIKDDWKGEPLDEHYIRMLSDLMNDGELVLKSGKLGDTLLGRIYFKSHVLSSRVYKIFEDEKSFYYLSINFNATQEVDDPNFREVCRPHITRLRQLFHDKKG